MDKRNYKLSRFLLTVILVLGFVLTLSGCSLFRSRDDFQGEPVARPIPQGITEVKLAVKRSDYSEHLQRGESINRARFVPVYSRGGSSGEFRIFDVKPGSIFELLGMKSLDIVVAANGYMVPGGNVFWAYLVMMEKLPEGTIEIRRNGIPLLLRYKFY